MSNVYACRKHRDYPLHFREQLYPERLPTATLVWTLDFPNSNGISTLLSSVTILVLTFDEKVKYC